MRNIWLDPTIIAYKRQHNRRAKPVVWEVGSRDGDDGFELAKRIYTGRKDQFWNNATVVCFEPNPEQAEVIRQRYPEAEIYECAVSNEEGEADFKVYHGDEGMVGSSSLNLDWKGEGLEGHVIQVKVVRLDSLIRDEIIDIMKIDVEGYSLQVLEGLGDKINQVRVMHIETETWTKSNKKIKKFMKKRGWVLVDEVEQYGNMPDQVWVRG